MTKANCPNCGAPVTGPQCPYCSTKFESVADMAIGKTVNISFENDGLIYEFEMLVEHLNVDMNNEYATYYADNGPVLSTLVDSTYHVHFHGKVVPHHEAHFKVKEVRHE